MVNSQLAHTPRLCDLVASSASSCPTRTSSCSSLPASRRFSAKHRAHSSGAPRGSTAAHPKKARPHAATIISPERPMDLEACNSSSGGPAHYCAVADGRKSASASGLSSAKGKTRAPKLCLFRALPNFRCPVGSGQFRNGEIQRLAPDVQRAGQHRLHRMAARQVLHGKVALGFWPVLCMRCICSALLRSKLDYEIIIIDDGSPDGTQEAC